MKIKMKKWINYFLFLSFFLILFLISLSLLKKERKEDKKINTFENLETYYWLLSNERKAGILTQFNQGQSQLEKVIEKNKGKFDFDAFNYDEKEDKLLIKKNNHNLKIPVIITDLDETMLDNSWFAIKKKIKNIDKNFEKEWDKWVAFEKAKLFKGVLDFVRFAVSKKVPILFVSERKNETIKHTKNNLIEEGYFPELTNYDWFWWLKGKKDGKGLKGNENKEDRYRYIENNLIILNDSYGNREAHQLQIIMVIGDQLTDFNSNYFKNNNDKKNDYLSQPEILNQFGNASPRTTFYWENEKIKREIYNEEYYSTYLLISSNNTYGNFKKNFPHDPQEQKNNLTNYLEKFLI
jgi:predicted secreted acid phosphatase